MDSFLILNIYLIPLNQSHPKGITTLPSVSVSGDYFFGVWDSFSCSCYGFTLLSREVVLLLFFLALHIIFILNCYLEFAFLLHVGLFKDLDVESLK